MVSRSRDLALSGVKGVIGVVFCALDAVRGVPSRGLVSSNVLFLEGGAVTFSSGTGELDEGAVVSTDGLRRSAEGRLGGAANFSSEFRGVSRVDGVGLFMSIGAAMD